MKESNLKYPFAKTIGDKLVFIDNAEKHTRYYCWGCDAPMFRRGGEHRTDHFYHKGDTCAFESALHNAFKVRLFQIIDTGLRQKAASGNKNAKINIRWYCEKCKMIHKGNLLKPIADAKLECHVDKFRPDISLYRTNGSVYAVIEIEYTHSVEDRSKKFYEDNNIGIIVFSAYTIDDLRSLEGDSLIPSSCNLCKHRREDLKSEENIVVASCGLETQEWSPVRREQTSQANKNLELQNEKRNQRLTLTRIIGDLFKRILALLRPID